MTTTPKHTSKPKTYIYFSRFLMAAFVVIVVFITTLLKIPIVQASPQLQATSTSTPQTAPTFDLQRLEKPVVASDNTEQLKKGSIVYWGICMACHGDHGQ